MAGSISFFWGLAVFFGAGRASKKGKRVGGGGGVGGGTPNYPLGPRGFHGGQARTPIGVSRGKGGGGGPNDQKGGPKPTGGGGGGQGGLKQGGAFLGPRGGGGRIGLGMVLPGGGGEGRANLGISRKGIWGVPRGAPTGGAWSGPGLTSMVPNREHFPPEIWGREKAPFASKGGGPQKTPPNK